MIKLSNIRKSYPMGDTSVDVLCGIDLNISTGEFVAIMGPSGSGKSTLLNIIGCLDTADTGQFKFNGVEIDKLNEDKLAVVRNRNIGFVFQLFNLIPRLNAVRNAEMPMIYMRLSPEERKLRAIEALKKVGLGAVLEHTPAQMSGGQQQRVAIARSLVNAPSLLIADEPTGSLDSKTAGEIMDLFTQLNRDGKTVVMVTHEEDIAAYANRIVRVRDGHIQLDTH